MCSGSAMCEAGECVESCENCSFETGDFTGWTVVDLTEPFIAAAVLEDGMVPGGVVALPGPAFAAQGAQQAYEGELGFGVILPPMEGGSFFGPVTATDGTYVAVNGFDGNGPGTIEFGQDITLREGVTTVEFDYRLGWDLLNEADATVDRTFEVHIEPEGGGKPLETVLIETAAFDTVGDTGLSSGAVDVSTYAGQTVFVNFVWVVPENFTGPAQAELDNIRVLAE